MAPNYCPTVGRKGFSYIRADEGEDWREIDDIAHRRRIQNRLAQRKYREKMQSTKESPQNTSPSTSPGPSTGPQSSLPPSNDSCISLPNLSRLDADPAGNFQLPGHSIQSNNTFDSSTLMSSLESTLLPENTYYSTAPDATNPFDLFRESSQGADPLLDFPVDFSIPRSHSISSTSQPSPAYHNLSWEEAATMPSRPRYQVTREPHGPMETPKYSLSVQNLAQEQLNHLLSTLRSVE